MGPTVAFELWFSTYGIEYFGLTNSTIPTMIKYNKENQILINYYFGSLNEKEITESRAVDISSLFSDIGGQCGLFLGLSVVTIFELTQFLFHFVYYGLLCRGK